MSRPRFHIPLPDAYPDGLFMYAVGREQPWSDCAELPRLGVSLLEVASFEVLS